MPSQDAQLRLMEVSKQTMRVQQYHHQGSETLVFVVPGMVAHKSPTQHAFRLLYTLVCRLLLAYATTSKHPGQHLDTQDNTWTPRTHLGRRDREEAQLSQSSCCSTHPCWYYTSNTASLDTRLRALL
jgi:hypothetical protein